VTLSIMTIVTRIKGHCAECHSAECRVLFSFMLNVIMLSVVMQSVVMLSVVAPQGFTINCSTLSVNSLYCLQMLD
jgi:hypothetical protein